MNDSTRLRVFLPLAALAAGIALVFAPVGKDDGISHAVERAPRTASTSLTMPGGDTALAQVPRSGKSDPFAPRQWRAAPPVAVAPTVPVAPAPAAMPALQPTLHKAPTMPYKFVGQMDDGGRVVVYLSRGEQVLLARLGEIVEGEYKVVSITPSEVTFEYLPAGTTQILSIHVTQ